MYELDKRCLIGINKATLITLPISWIRNNGLVKGQKVSVALDDSGRLVITPPEKGIPATGAEFGDNTPAAGGQHTPNGAIADA